MKVKIGNKMYSGEDEPIMIIFDEGETYRIGGMRTENKKYCAYPSEGYSDEEIEKFMNTEDIEKMVYVEGDIFEIDSKEYALRVLNDLGGCWLEPVIHRTTKSYTSGGMNKCCGYKELKNFKYVARI